MNEREREEIKRLLKEFVPAAGQTELGRDLWPTMLKRLEQQPIRMPWWDWALLAGVTVLFCLFPGMIPALLYHL
ncbi:MAG TPA: hypothetical protein VEI54_10205 [Candidatus Limnocylindrales bacterium]|nr:hypothetical protein [Candidatus Limnocylindrales bacterium]